MLNVNVSGTVFDGFSFFASGGFRNSGSGNDPRADLKWHFIAGTWDGVTLKYYIDGVLIASNSPSLTWATAPLLPSSTANISIGVYRNDSIYFDGYLKNMRIYNRALSQGELRQLMGEPWRPFVPSRLNLRQMVSSAARRPMIQVI